MTVQPETWTTVKKYDDILFEKTEDGIAKIVINRPARRNAFRPKTVIEMIEAFSISREDPSIGVIILTAPATRRSAPAATRRFAETRDTWTRAACPG